MGVCACTNQTNMPDKHQNFNDILYQLREKFAFRMRLYAQRDDKASLELKVGTMAYRVDYIYEPREVFKGFVGQQRSLLQEGAHGSLFIHFFANHQREWILQIDRFDRSIEISLNKVMNWQRLVNKFKANCDVSEYLDALYLFAVNLPDHTQKKGGIENS